MHILVLFFPYVNSYVQQPTSQRQSTQPPCHSLDAPSIPSEVLQNDPIIEYYQLYSLHTDPQKFTAVMISVILLTVTEAVVNLDITTQGIQAMATCKLKVLLADRLSWCEQSAESIKCYEPDMAVHLCELKCRGYIQIRRYLS